MSASLLRSWRLAGLGLVLAAGTAEIVTAAPVYSGGQIGTFGNGEMWSGSQEARFFGTAGNAFSARFTAKENLTIDRAVQRYTSIPAGAQIRISLIKDSGGSPSNNPLDVLGTTDITYASA